MYILITATVGADAGPFNLYSDVDGYTTAFEVGIPGPDLVNFFSNNAPDGTTSVMVKSFGACTNQEIILVIVPTTTSTTSTTTLPLMWPVVGTCCGLVTTEYLPFDGVTVFQVGDIVAAYVIADNYFGGWEIQGAPVPGVATLYPYDNNNYFNCSYFLAVFVPSCTII